MTWVAAVIVAVMLVGAYFELRGHLRYAKKLDGDE